METYRSVSRSRQLPHLFLVLTMLFQFDSLLFLHDPGQLSIPLFYAAQLVLLNCSSSLDEQSILWILEPRMARHMGSMALILPCALDPGVILPIPEREETK